MSLHSVSPCYCISLFCSESFSYSCCDPSGVRVFPENRCVSQPGGRTRGTSQLCLSQFSASMPLWTTPRPSFKRQPFHRRRVIVRRVCFRIGLNKRRWDKIAPNLCRPGIKNCQTINILLNLDKGYDNIGLSRSSLGIS